MWFLKILKKYLISSLVVILTFFLMAFFITDYFYNAKNAKYVYFFDATGDVEELVTTEYFDSVIKEIDEYNKHNEKKISYANIEYEEMLESATLTHNEHYELTILMKYFPTNVRSNGLVNESDSRATKYLNLIFSYSDCEVNFVELKIVGYVSPFLIGGIVGLITLGVILILLLIIYIVFGFVINDIEDNVEIYYSVFHKSYWKKSLGFMSRVKNLCTISILFAMMLVCKLIPIPSGFGSLGLGLTYLFFSVICLIYGPICGLFIGFFSDILGYFLFQGGSIFFIGYTLSSMLTGFIYGIFLYRKKITFANCLLARFFVNLAINVALGSIWWKIVYGLDMEAVKTYVMLTSLPKNVLYLLPQSLLMFVVIKMIAKPLSRFGLINDKIAQNVELF